MSGDAHGSKTHAADMKKPQVGKLAAYQYLARKSEDGA